MSTCPVCGKAVDPLRAPAMKVRDGKVVAYCSKEHSEAQETKPTAAPVAAAAAAAKRTPAKGTPVAKRTPASGVPQSARDLDSGPVIEVLHEPATGVVTSSADARIFGAGASNARSQADGAIQIADTGHIDDYVDVEGPPRRSRALLVVLLFLLVAAGSAFAAYRMGYFGQVGRSESAEPPPAPPAPRAVAIDAPPPISPADAVDRARTVLRTQLKSDSPRVQRVAAAALARTGDAEALSALATMMTKETSDIAKLDVAYALARAGDKRGTEALVQALSAPRRDVKAEAANRLAQLGDKRAAAVLEQFLEISQHRLSAAEQLALLQDPPAIAALEAIRADEKASADDKARAAIALGLANKTSVTPALHALLDDARFNAFAAAALAVQHDEAARPVLVKQLDIPSLRTATARALRQLEPQLDPSPFLDKLVAALDSAKDTERVQVAEAILLLAGPIAWAERP